MPRYARVCPNKHDWTYPDDGTKGGGGLNFPATYGFGFEEWLGRLEWVWNGPRFDWMKDGVDYHCGFLQAFKEMPKEAQLTYHWTPVFDYDIELYIKDYKTRRVAVGHIDNCRWLQRNEIVQIYNTYNANGWLKTMQTELDAANRTATTKYKGMQAYGSQLVDMSQRPGDIFNACFAIHDFHIGPNVIRSYNHERYTELYY